jgi:glycosyltransferase involved in cell wall biosynthesis
LNILYAYRYGIVGGVSTQLRLRQQALRKAGHRCDLFFSQDNGLRGVSGDAKGLHFGSNIRYALLLKQGKYDHVVVIDTPELLSASFSSWWQSPRKVWLDVHTTTATGLSYLAKINAEELSGVMVPTHYSAALVRDCLPSVQPLVIPNVIDGSVFYPSSSDEPDAAALESSPRQFIWVGKLDSHKNWRLALVYAQVLQELFGQIRFIMVGGYTAPAETGKAFFEQAQNLGVLQAIRWIDRIDNKELATLYRHCTRSGGAMLVTSRDESFGMAAAEALMCGCPLIANDLPVFHEVFPSSPMIKLVDIWNPEAVALAAEEVVALQHQEELTTQVYAKLKDSYGPAAFVESFLNLLAERSQA